MTRRAELGLLHCGVETGETLSRVEWVQQEASCCSGRLEAEQRQERVHGDVEANRVSNVQSGWETYTENETHESELGFML